MARRAIAIAADVPLLSPYKAMNLIIPINLPLVLDGETGSVD
jgi:hypothetical protein